MLPLTGNSAACSPLLSKQTGGSCFCDTTIRVTCSSPAPVPAPEALSSSTGSLPRKSGGQATLGGIEGTETRWSLHLVLEHARRWLCSTVANAEGKEGENIPVGLWLLWTSAGECGPLTSKRGFPANSESFGPRESHFHPSVVAASDVESYFECNMYYYWGLGFAEREIRSGKKLTFRNPHNTWILM